MHVHTSHQTAVLVTPGHISWRKCPLVFPLMFYDCSVCLQPFILVELSPTTTRCCSCSFRLQAGWGCQDLGDVTLYLFAWIMNAWGWDDGGLEVTVFTAAVFHKFMNYSYSVRWDMEMIMFVKFYDLVLCTLFTLNYVIKLLFPPTCSGTTGRNEQFC